jgi:hypothetical protein
MTYIPQGKGVQYFSIFGYASRRRCAKAINKDKEENMLR